MMWSAWAFWSPFLFLGFAVKRPEFLYSTIAHNFHGKNEWSVFASFCVHSGTHKRQVRDKKNNSRISLQVHRWQTYLHGNFRTLARGLWQARGISTTNGIWLKRCLLKRETHAKPNSLSLQSVDFRTQKFRFTKLILCEKDWSCKSVENNSILAKKEC